MTFTTENKAYQRKAKFYNRSEREEGMTGKLVAQFQYIVIVQNVSDAILTETYFYFRKFYFSVMVRYLSYSLYYYRDWFAKEYDFYWSTRGTPNTKETYKIYFN